MDNYILGYNPTDRLWSDFKNIRIDIDHSVVADPGSGIHFLTMLLNGSHRM